MLSNTGTISFWLYGIFILLIIIALIVAVYTIKKETISTEKLEKIIDLFKYAIVTTSIATVTLVIGDLFKERDYDKSEMAAFNEYIPYVIDTVGTIDKKINFCKFFSSVTPKGDLRKGWEHYTVFLETEKNILIAKTEKSKENGDKIEKANDTIQVSESLLSVAKNVEGEQQILANINATEVNEFIVVLGADAKAGKAEYELKWVKDNGYPIAKIYKKGKWYMTVIPEIKTFQNAKDIADKIKNLSNGTKKTYITSAKSWCSNPRFSETEKCSICN